MPTTREAPPIALAKDPDGGDVVPIESRASIEEPRADESLESPDAEVGRRRARPTRRLTALGTGSVIPGTPYRLRRWLGDGGMGAVFEAQHVDVERRVAVKLLHAHSVKRPWVVEGFRNEARASARIGAPNIVEIYDFKELDDGRLLIAMEYLDGGTLRDLLEQGPLTWPLLIAVTRQICQGLAAAHEARIVHRDIKPENIMLTTRDRREHFVKIVDFGVAHFMVEGPAPRAVGTAQYMAPESVTNTGDPRVDIYAMGCLLYELVTGVTPFDGDSAPEILARQAQETPKPLSARTGREIPSRFEDIVSRCLQKDAEDRFQTMVELEAALCELQIEQRWSTPWDHLPVPEVEPARRERIEQGFRSLQDRRRHRVWLPRLLLVGLVAAASVTILGWPQDPPVAASTSQIEAFTLAARTAASRFYFVYPPADDPEGSTAFREVVALEAIDDPGAAERAKQLRDEFARTLVRLGDRYWDFQGGRPFAYEYYAAALMFTDDPRARERVGVTPMTLELMRDKAVEQDFAEHELLAAESLAALAEPDAQVRVKRLEALAGQPIAASVAASLEEVIEQERRLIRDDREHEGRGVGAPPVAAEDTDSRADSEGEESSGADQPEGIGETEQDGASEPSTPATDRGSSTLEQPKVRRGQVDNNAAKEHVAAAKAARKRGDLEQAEVLLHRALAANPRSLAAMDGLASLAYANADYASSVRYLEHAVTLGPRSARRWLALGDAYYKTLRYADADVAYSRAQELGSDAAEARRALVQGKLGG